MILLNVYKHATNTKIKIQISVIQKVLLIPLFIQFVQTIYNQENACFLWL